MPHQDFSLYPQIRTSIPVLRGRVDGYPIEEHRLDLGTTENPVESGSTLTDNAVKRREKLTLEGWVSDILPAPGNELTPDRAADVWGAVIELFKRRIPVTVVTGLRTYRNMLVVQAIAPVDKMTGRALRFTMRLTEVLFADTELARFAPDDVDLNGPAAERTSEVDGGDRPSLKVNVDGDRSAIEQFSSAAVDSLPSDPNIQTETLSSTLVQMFPGPRPSLPELSRATINRFGGVPRLPSVHQLIDRVLDRLPHPYPLPAQHIPLSGDARQTFRTILSGQNVRLRSFWQPTDRHHYVSLSNLDRTPIALGFRLLDGGRPFRGVVQDFAGELLVDGVGELTREAFTRAHRLLHVVTS